MDRRTALGAGAIVIGAASLGYALFAKVSDEELIADLLNELARTVSFSEPIGNVVFHGSRLSERFQELMTERVDIRISEVQSALPNRALPNERGKLGLAAAHTLSRYGSLDVSLSINTLRIEGDSASCKATATLIALEQGAPRRDTRPVDFTLIKDDGSWRIQAARVRAPSDDS